MTYNQRYTQLIGRRNSFKLISLTSLFLSYAFLLLGGYISFNRHLISKWLIFIPAMGLVGTSYYSRKQWMEIDEELGIAQSVIKQEIEKAYRVEFSPSKDMEVEIMPILPPASHALSGIGTQLINGLNDNFEIKLDWVNGVSGCTLNRIYLRPHPKVKVGSLQSLSEDVQMLLGVKNPPLIQPSQYGLCIDVEKPAENREIVLYSNTVGRMKNAPTNGDSSGLLVAIGIDVMGSLISIDMSDPDTPHILLGGTTGSGKSEMQLSMLASLLNWYSPNEVQLILLDPKRTAFIPTPLKDSPYLMEKVVCNIEEGINVLAELDSLMDARYKLFADAGAVDIKAYNMSVNQSNQPNKNKTVPHIVCVIDELASYTLAPDKKVKKEAIRLLDALGRLARGAGIHLIAATQKPKADVIPSEITANFGARIALRTKTAKEGEIIMGDSCPSHHLLGKGDALYDGVRIQSLYLKDRTPLGAGVGIHTSNHNKSSLLLNKNDIPTISGRNENFSFLQDSEIESIELIDSVNLDKTGKDDGNDRVTIDAANDGLYDASCPSAGEVDTDNSQNSHDSHTISERENLSDSELKMRYQKYRELRECREQRMTKTQIVSEVWKLPNRNFKDGSYQYSSLVREFGIEWIEELLINPGSHGSHPDSQDKQDIQDGHAPTPPTSLSGKEEDLTSIPTTVDTVSTHNSKGKDMKHIEVFKLIYSPTKKKSSIKEGDKADFLSKLSMIGVAPDSTIR